MPPTLPSVKPAQVNGLGPGLKFDDGKVRADLLPAGAVLCAMRAPAYTDVHAQVFLWRRGQDLWVDGNRRMAVVASTLLWRLARDMGVDHVGPALAEVAKVLTFGAGKYGANNWQQVTPYDRYYAALLRHLFAYDGGELTDRESGLPHLAHAACCALFLLSREVGHDPVSEPSE